MQSSIYLLIELCIYYSFTYAYVIYIYIIITYMGYGHNGDPYHGKITSVDGLITILQVCALKKQCFDHGASITQ